MFYINDSTTLAGLLTPFFFAAGAACGGTFVLIGTLVAPSHKVASASALAVVASVMSGIGVAVTSEIVGLIPAAGAWGAVCVLRLVRARSKTHLRTPAA